MILAFGANAKLLNFTEKLKTASGTCRINMVTWSFLPFAVNVILNLCINGKSFPGNLQVTWVIYAGQM